MAVPEIDVAHLSSLMAEGVRVIDVRETDEYVSGHVPGAVHVALGTVPQHVGVFQGEGPAYVICKAGGRSMQACQFLDQQGVQVVNIAGGTMAWASAGYPLVTGSSPA